jgi:cytochrome P450
MAGGHGVTTELRPTLPAGPDLSASRVSQRWIEEPIEFWEECAAQYGETVTVELGSLGTTVLFSNPEAVREIFQLPGTAFECAPYNEHYKYVMGAGSVLLTDGTQHLRKRKLLSPSLYRRLAEDHGEAIRQFAREAIASWPVHAPFSPRHAMHMVALKIILQVFFGGSEDSPVQEIADVFSRKVYNDLSSWGPWTRFSRLQPWLGQLIGAEVERKRAALEAPTGALGLIDHLVRARTDSGEALSDEEIQGHFFTMLIGGADTTALALSWAFYWIHEEPRIVESLKRELAASAATSDILEMPFMRAVCHEVLRMYPVVTTPTGRKLHEETSIQGRSYPPGVTLLPVTYLVHHRPDLYPEPYKFRPERFLERQFAQHEYFPFGGGARTCMGAVLAPLEMKLVLAELHMRCEFSPVHDGPVRPARHGTLLAPSDSMKFALVNPPDLSHGNVQ